jgi:hypothetical protein
MKRLSISLGLTALLAFVAFASTRMDAPAIEAPMEPKRDHGKMLTKRINYDGTDDPKVKLIEILEEFETQYNLTIAIDERAFEEAGIKDLKNFPVTADGKAIPKMKDTRFDRVLKQVFSRIGAVEVAFVPHEDAIEITTRPALLARIYGNNPRRSLPLVYAEFEKQPLEDALKELADQSDFNVLVDPRPAEKIRTSVTAKLKNVPLDSAVQLLADMADLKAVLQDNVLYVTTKENAKVIEAEMRERNKNDTGVSNVQRSPSK